MSPRTTRLSLTRLALFLSIAAAAPAQTEAKPRTAQERCTVDLTRVGQMEDILSNALMLGLGKDAARVQTFLKRTRRDCKHGDELLTKTAAGFGIEEAELQAAVERYRHVNCKHAPGAPAAESETTPAAPAAPLPAFAKDVTMHVVLHELGHALVREFDLPVLGNEETLADAFATHYLTTHLPERAVDVLSARVASLMYEAREVARDEWPVRGEHNSDARRAFQIAALAVAADPQKYAPVADLVDMSADDRRRAADYGAEIHRSWRRLLRPLWTPPGHASSEARVRCEGDNGTLGAVQASGLLAELDPIVRRFDWHSQVTIRFVDGDGGAGWSRSKRAVTVHTRYVERFVAQGAALADGR